MKTAVLIIKGAKFVKNNWKKIAIALFAILLVPIAFSVSYTTTKAIPALNEDQMRIYIEEAAAVGKDKTVIDWKNLVAIDAVRYKQNFKLANKNNIDELAKRFIKEDKKTITYDFSKYKSITDSVNNTYKSYKLNIDWRYVVMVDAAYENKNKKAFPTKQDSTINDIVNRFIKQTTKTETYTETTVTYVKKIQYVYVLYVPGHPEIGGYWQMEVVTVPVYTTVTKTRTVPNYVARSYKDVLEDMYLSEKDIPDDFSNVNNITVKYSKTTITYSTKSLDEVMKEMGFSSEDQKSIRIYRNVGLNIDYESDMNNDDMDPSANISSQEFISKVSPEAIVTYKKDKVFPSITIAQSILESGWGKTKLSTKANNLFGIKADSGWDGPYVTMETTEYTPTGQKIEIEANFRAYSDWQGSIDDHGEFLVVNSTYREHGVFTAKDYIEQAYALKNAGYATDPNYAVSLIELINKYGLSKYDQMAVGN